MKQILALSHVRKSDHGKVVLDDVDAGVPARREDRRGRAERYGQVHAAADDGRPGAAYERRGPSHARLQRRVLPQEPALDEGKTVLGTVEEGVAGPRP